MASEYSSGRDHISSAKLNYFHYFLKQLTGYLLHPSIEAGSRPRRIADLGTQTAIWPIDVAEDGSLNATVDAFDISDKFFPPSAWLPSNSRLHIHDVYKPFDKELLGAFDVVNLRLWLTLSTAQVRDIVANAVQLLKPGGYIQWLEHDKTNLSTTSAVPHRSREAAEAFNEFSQNPFPGYNAGWVHDIAPALSSKGLKVIAQDRITVRPSLLPQINELHLMAMMDIPNGLSKAVDGFRAEYMDRLMEEYRDGVASVDGFLCVVAQKQL